MDIMFYVGLLILITTIGLLVGIITENDDNFVFSIIVGFIMLIGFGCVITAYNSHREPTAMDVYQGKTELRITYEGKTPVDSTVVYKKGK